METKNDPLFIEVIKKLKNGQYVRYTLDRNTKRPIKLVYLPKRETPIKSFFYKDNFLFL